MPPEYNLIDEPWLPVLDEHGIKSFISPKELGSTRFVSFDTGRADLDVGLMEFCIGLLQTCYAPRDDRAWTERFLEPPTPELLEEAFAPVRHAFWLFNDDGPRFMQDLAELDVSVVGAAQLLIDSPGENTLKENKDLFIKRAPDAGYSAAAAAAMLYTRQTRAPGGGPGYRTSVRGGSALTTILIAQNLWTTLWSNVLDTTHTLPEDLSTLFPWLSATQTSSNNEEITPADAHPLHVYWAMPWRIVLCRAVPDERAPRCALYPGHLVALTGWRKTNYGGNYKGNWRHPLTPRSHKYDKQGALEGSFSIGSKDKLVRWSSWPSLSLMNSTTQERPDSEPARCIAVARARLSSTRKARKKIAPAFAGQRRIHVAGYDMDSAKANAWISATVPFLDIDAAIAPRVRERAELLISVTEKLDKFLFDALKRITAGRVIDVTPRKVTWSKIPTKDLANIRMSCQPRRDAFKDALEDDFFQALQNIADDPSDERWIEVAEEWLERAHTVLQELIELERPQDAHLCRDLRAYVFARRELLWACSPRSKVLRGILGLPEAN